MGPFVGDCAGSGGLSGIMRIVRRVAIAVSVLALLAAGCSSGGSKSSSTSPNLVPSTSIAAVGIHKIRHVVVIMQENRSFDSYFGTFPGADGIPKTACVPDPNHAGACVRPYPDHADVNGGGPHGQANAAADLDGDR